MPFVSLEEDATYRRDGLRYVEVCRACRQDRAGDGPCACGATFDRKRGSIISVTPTSLRPTLPNVCPHCGAVPSRVRGLATVVPGQVRVTFEVPTCPRVLPPFAAYALLIFSIFWFVVGALATVFGHLDAIPLAAIALAGALASWRAYAWIRVVRADHRSIRFRVRRFEYAIALADMNGGRVIGTLRPDSAQLGGAIPAAKIVSR